MSTVTERLGIAVQSVGRNEMLTRQRVDLLEKEVTRLLKHCGLEPTVYESEFQKPECFEGEKN